MDALAAAAGAAMTDRNTGRKYSDGARSTIRQSAIKKPLARSVEIRLEKLRERLAKKDAQERLLSMRDVPSRYS